MRMCHVNDEPHVPQWPVSANGSEERTSTTLLVIVVTSALIAAATAKEHHSQHFAALPRYPMPSAISCYYSIKGKTICRQKI